MRAHRPQPAASGAGNEAYLKLIDPRSGLWQGRAHFLALAAQAMRRILVDHARTHGRAKRGAGAERVTLSDLQELSGSGAVDVIDLDEALRRLAADEPEASRVVEMRFFGGMNELEIAEILSISERTVRRHWTYARARLFRELGTAQVAGA